MDALAVCFVLIFSILFFAWLFPFFRFSLTFSAGFWTFFCVIWKTLQLVNCSHVFIVVEFGLVCAALSGGSYQLPLPVALVSSICLHSPTWPFGAGNAFDISSDDCLKSPLMIWCVFYVCVERCGWGRLGGVLRGRNNALKFALLAKHYTAKWTGQSARQTHPHAHTWQVAKPNQAELNRTEPNKTETNPNQKPPHTAMPPSFYFRF